MKIFLLSESFISVHDENGVKIKSEIDKNNSFLDNLTKSITEFDNFLFICNKKRVYDVNDKSAKMIFDSLIEGGLPFKNCFVLDKRTIKEAGELIEKANFIYIQGGTLPGQLRLLKKVNFTEHIKKSNAVIAGKSAGAMNLGKTVYAFPERKIEKLSKRFLNGLGYYDYIIIPHFNLDKNGYEYDVSGINLLRDYFIPNSKGRKFYAIPQGSYIFLDEDKHYLYGEGYTIENGEMKKVCENGEFISLN